MNRSFFPLVLLLSLFVTILSCSNKSTERPRKPVSSIRIKPAKNQFVYGEKIAADVKTKLKDGEIKSITLFYENEVLKNTKELEFTVNDIELNKLGNNKLMVNAEKTDGLKNTRSKIITVVSDIQPQELSYRVINNYPHLKSSYTQGLEFYNGYLYEGTGENGHSKLMKVDLQTGKPLQTFELDDKYFGEGITILDDKVYQLTYRAKKGFVYNLKTFAVIDSFTFNSVQGWGLTNDGKNLIMSDGTHVITWLDPEDFSVVKKIQVADNKGLVINLNELEYIDGIIYANIYTTNRIVKIDAASGKVMEEIDLTGIINLYHRAGDRIDYLNGIAYDKQNDRIFVTGKLYPRLFEVQFVEKE
jgi:glutaminyl-peptide cyclotransferase